jgi:parallel beta helix pectate lyase-like protein
VFSPSIDKIARVKTACAIVIAALTAAATSGPARAACDKVASLRGSNADRGTAAHPYATVGKLANSLRPGQTGCLRTGVYRGRIKVRKGGRSGAPTTIRSAPGQRATVRGRLWVANSANHVVFRQLFLNGRNGARLPSPTVNGNDVVFRNNDITTRNTTICFVLGSDEYGRALRTVIERNQIHDCGALPPTNHHHGIYVEASDGVRITGNWIYDNADRGVQLFPDAQRTYVARNVIDGNGEGIVFARESAHNVVERNVISNSVIRYNVEDYDLSGGGNVARRNCLWSPSFGGNGLVSPGIGVDVSDNLVIDPGYRDRDGKDFRLSPASPCFSFSPSSRRPGPR